MLTTGIILSMVFIIPVGIFVFCIILPIIDDYEPKSEQKQEKTDVDPIKDIKECIDFLNEIRLDEQSKGHFYASEDIAKEIEFLEEQKKIMEDKDDNGYI